MFASGVLAIGKTKRDAWTGGSAYNSLDQVGHVPTSEKHLFIGRHKSKRLAPNDGTKGTGNKILKMNFDGN